jgi:hypothetical protein
MTEHLAALQPAQAPTKRRIHTHLNTEPLAPTGFEAGIDIIIRGIHPRMPPKADATVGNGSSASTRRPRSPASTQPPNPWPTTSFTAAAAVTNREPR